MSICQCPRTSHAEENTTKWFSARMKKPIGHNATNLTEYQMSSRCWSTKWGWWRSGSQCTSILFHSRSSVLMFYSSLFIILLLHHASVWTNAINNDNSLSKLPATTTTTTTTLVTLLNPYSPKDRIVNPHNFSYILNPGYTVCDNNNSSVYMLVYVHSGPSNYQRRIVIRETWATRTLFPDLRLVFMIGQTLDKNLMKAIEYENEMYQDIVQEDFIDSYKNLTYKGVMALKWISTYCSKTKYVLKVDDDIVVNTFTLINHLKFLDKHTPHRENTILCLLWQAMGVMRDRSVRLTWSECYLFWLLCFSKSKWYLSKEDFPLDKFPPYCSGSGKWLMCWSLRDESTAVVNRRVPSNTRWVLLFFPQPRRPSETIHNLVIFMKKKRKRRNLSSSSEQFSRL